MKAFYTILLAFWWFAATAQNTLLYQPSMDTITNTGADTLTFTPPAKNYDFVIDLAIVEAISGTDSLTLTVQESVDNTYWWNSATAVTLNTATNTGKVSGTLYGKYQRAIITGKATQSTSYKTNFFYRRKD